MKKTGYRVMAMVLCFVLMMSSSVLLTSAATKYTYNSTQLTQLDNAFKKHGWVIKQGFWANTKAVVKPVQTMLKELGYGSLSVDGVFGSATKKAVINFQGKNKLAKDGCVGTGTWNKLVSAYRSAISKNTVSSTAKAKGTSPQNTSSSQSSAPTSNNAGYSVTKALQFAKKHAYTNTNWLCAEYVSRCLKAGGWKSDVFPGVGDLYRALEKTKGVTKYTLTVESNGKILPKKNQGKIASGDVIIMRHKGEPDGKEYIHAVIVGDLNNNGIKVYAHNSAYSNEVYTGFNYCGYCKKRSSNVVAYGFHFAQ